MAHKHLMDISDPNSRNFGKHWSLEKVHETFTPDKSSYIAITKWLSDHGIETEVDGRNSLNWLVVSLTFAELETLLATKYHFYQHPSGRRYISCEDYSIPEELGLHIETVIPSIRADYRSPGGVLPISTNPTSLSTLSTSAGNIVSSPVDDLSICGSRMTIDCIRSLYGIPTGASKNPNNTIG